MTHCVSEIYPIQSDSAVISMDLLPDKQNCGLRMRRECRECFPHHWLQRKQLVNDHGMHHGTCVTHDAVMHVGIANPWWRGKGSRHYRRMRNPHFCISGKRSMLCASCHSEPGSLFNIKMSSYQYKKSHCGDKTVVRSSYLHNGISYTGKMTSLCWIRALVAEPGEKEKCDKSSY